MGGFLSLTNVQNLKPSMTTMVPRCGLCKLYKNCNSPKMPVSGNGKRKVLIVGEAPGGKEDEQGRQFVGKAGQYLRRVARKIGIDPKEDCWLTNALICRPPNNYISNERMVEWCNPGETPMWMGDLSFKPISEIKKGDEVIGWERTSPTVRLGHSDKDKNIKHKTRKKLVKSIVTAIHTRMAKVVKVTMESGRVIRCTANHKWLDGKHPWMNNKETFREPKIGNYLCHVVTPLEECLQELKYAAGYMGGILDGEGSISRSWIQIYQSWEVNSKVCLWIEKVANKLGLSYSWRSHVGVGFDSKSPGVYALSMAGIENEVKIFNWCKPAKNKNRLKTFIMNRSSFIKKDRIVSIEPDGYEKVYGLTTTTGNYIAWGYASKNCRPNLIHTINTLQPTTIILLGGVAVKSLLEYVWKEDVGGIARWAGFQIPNQKLNCWIFPTYHPSYLMRMDDSALDLYFAKHLEAAFEKEDRPWPEIPDYRSRIQLVHDPLEVERIIEKMISKGGTVAIDYETNMLKPDSKEAEIVCCSVCWNGRWTIAYPWVGEAIRATKRLWLSKLSKVASNAKFEHRWTRAKLGVEVRNWKHDTMLAAHIADNRSGITSIKFQAMVKLGVDAWDTEIKPYLAARYEGGPNRIKEVSLDKLLLYCAYDSLYEYLVADIQIKEMGL